MLEYDVPSGTFTHTFVRQPSLFRHLMHQLALKGLQICRKMLAMAWVRVRVRVKVRVKVRAMASARVEDSAWARIRGSLTRKRLLDS